MEGEKSFTIENIANGYIANVGVSRVFYNSIDELFEKTLSKFGNIFKESDKIKIIIKIDIPKNA